MRILPTGMAVYGPSERKALEYDAHSEPYQPPQTGPGFFNWITPGNPAAGVQLIRTVPGDVWEQPIFLRATLTTSAVVANRTPMLFLQPPTAQGTNVTGLEFPQPAQAATTTDRYNFAANFGPANFNAGGRFLGSFATYILPPGSQWGLKVLSMDAGDTLFDIMMYVEQWRNVPARRRGKPAL